MIPQTFDYGYDGFRNEFENGNCYIYSHDNGNCNIYDRRNGNGCGDEGVVAANGAREGNGAGRLYAGRDGCHYVCDNSDLPFAAAPDSGPGIGAGLVYPSPLRYEDTSCTPGYAYGYAVSPQGVMAAGGGDPGCVFVSPDGSSYFYGFVPMPPPPVQHFANVLGSCEDNNVNIAPGIGSEHYRQQNQQQPSQVQHEHDEQQREEQQDEHPCEGTGHWQTGLGEEVVVQGGGGSSNDSISTSS